MNMHSNVMTPVRPEPEDEERQEYPLICDKSMRKSLKSIPSFSNIDLISEEHGDLPLEELKAKPIIIEEDDEESEDETTEVEEEISQDTETAELHFPHQLSIIYEENESNERRSSVGSRCSTMSDCSTTLMEEDNISVDYSADELDEENSNSITVRLPLKFSFTRNKDNLVNTVLTVGNSESEFSENNSSRSFEEAEETDYQKKEIDYPRTKSKTPELIKSPTPPTTNGFKSNEPSTADVSVTVRLKSKSKTPERIITPILSVHSNSVDSDPECSVSISLPRKSKTKEVNFENLQENVEEKSDNSNDNKKNIDSSLFTSLDALEEIKRGMAEMTNSLCSKLCTLRKSALNIPTNDPYRSSSTSQIESIDTDSENDLSFSLSDYKMERRESVNHETVPDEYDGNYATQDTDYEKNQDDTEPNFDGSENCDIVNHDEGIDFWSQLSSANKTFEDSDAPHLSKTSTRSSRYWFEDDYEEPEIKEIEKDETEEKEMEEKAVIEESAEVDFWQDYDENSHAKFRASNFLYKDNQDEVVEENVSEKELNGENLTKNETNINKITNGCKEEESECEYETVSERIDIVEPEVNNINGEEEAEHTKIEEIVNVIELNNERQLMTDDELESDEEWTEEEVEVTDYDEVVDKAKDQIKSEINNQVKDSVIINNRQVVEESEYETEYEEETEAEEDVEPIAQHSSIIQNRNDDNERSCSENESEDEIAPCSKSSSSKITKGKSLVNVSSYISSANSRDKVPSSIQSINEDRNSDDSEYSSAEESDNEALPEISSNHSRTHSNDDCHVLTHNEHSHEVLMPTLTTMQSIDSKSNMTSESGISFEHNDPDSEDGYEEDSDEEVPPEDDNTITRETIKLTNDVDSEPEDEIKINVKGKISMFERAMSEEPPERIVKDVPRVQSKYSFKHRESSEPPMQKLIVVKSSAVSQRATSEIKEIARNHKLLDLISQRKSLPPMTDKEEEDQRKSVKERISSFETTESEASEKRETFKRYGNSKKSIPLVRSIDESGEEDSGVNSDFCKQFSENETDSENFPELRKMSRYQRASTHSRLFKLLQGDEDEEADEVKEAPKQTAPIPYKSKKIIHNVSVTRRQNPKAAIEAETMEERRQRLCLPLSHQSSSGADSMSSSTTPSPTPGVVNEKLVNELVQSLLSQKKGRAFKNLPIEKLHAAAVKILQEDAESNGTLSSADESTIPTVDSTPALTPQEFRNNSSYAEYYDSWDNNGDAPEDDLSDLNLIQSKAFKNLQDQQINASKKLWSVRCPRILSSKSINKDLARLSEVRESESPEPNHSRSPSIRSLSTEPMSGDNINIQERPRAKIRNT